MLKAVEIEWRRALRGEPALPEVLTDPIVQLLMNRDGVSRDDIQRLVTAYRRGVR
ncbi:MAG: hypothetical protein OXR84_13615 [Magnetovibrio sp.]|nr:hypothetical protein [Magnetovibrio sp.]